MYEQTMEDAHNYTDYHINQYDFKTYWGDILEKQIDHTGNIVITDPLTCVYCDVKFPSRNQLFRHLGYCDVDIRKRPKIARIFKNTVKNRKRKSYRQLKMTHFLNSLSYDADTEEDPRSNSEFKLESDLENMTALMKGLSYKSKSSPHQINKVRKNNKMKCQSHRINNSLEMCLRRMKI